MFLPGCVGAQDNIWQFDPALDKIYHRVLSLQVDQAYTEIAQLKGGNEFHKMYVQSFLETVDILITEDEKRFDKINEQIKKRIDKVSDMPETAETLFLRAELNLQRGFNLLNLSQELSAVLAIRQAYQASQECIKKYPSFIPIKKTYGVIQVMVGSVPGKYQWFMSLLGMRGSVKVGQKQLEELKVSKSSLNLEATIIYYAIKGFINQQFDEAAKGFQESLHQNPDSRLILFMAVNMLMKDSQSETAMKLIHELDKRPVGLQMPLIEYLRGEALAQRGEYAPAIVAYQKFQKTFKSQSLKKDSEYKIALCYYMLGDMTTAVKYFESAKTMGRTSADADKYADAMLQEGKFPNQKILRVRFLTDGGYYPKRKMPCRKSSPLICMAQKKIQNSITEKGGSRTKHTI